MTLRRRLFLFLVIGICCAALNFDAFNFSAESVLLEASIRIVGAKHYARVSNQISITVQANDEAGISRVELYLDQNLVSTQTIAPTAPYVSISFDLNTAQASNGKHVLQAKAFNVAGNLQTAVWVIQIRNYSFSSPTPTPVGINIVISPAVQFQTISGWEATAEAGQLFSPAWNNYQDALLDAAVNDLGINRIRAEIFSGTENSVDYFTQWRNGQISEQEYNATRFQIVNDNPDSHLLNTNNFQWSQIDSVLDNVVVPMRQRLAARGEQLYINLNYVDFGSSAFEHKSNPAEYAEFVLATYQHMQTKYGFVPDSWEVILEPDTSTAAWSATQVAQAIKAAGDRLVAAGFTPRFVAPSTTNGANAPIFIDQIAQNSNSIDYVSEFSYHRYCCVSEEVLHSIVSRAQIFNKRTAMLEWIGADYNTLHEDLKFANNSAWQQYTLAFPHQTDDGAQYYLINDANTNNPVILLTNRAKFLRQYFRYVRAGARRIEAVSGNQNFDALAFINTNGKYTVIVKAANGGTFNVQNLPAGNYGIKYTTAAEYDIDLADIALTPGQSLKTGIPAAGVITIFTR